MSALRYAAGNIESTLQQCRLSDVMGVLQAGPGRCALATSKKTTAAEISQRVDDLLESLYNRPLPVINTSQPGLLIRGHVLGTSCSPF